MFTLQVLPNLTIQQAFDLALQHHQSGRMAEADALYRQILAVDPRHTGSLHLLGVIAHQHGRNDVALELIRQAIALAPDVSDFHCNAGAVLRALGQLDAAIAACRRAVALRPNLPEAHMNLGNALHDAGRLEEAIAAHRQAVALRPGYPDAHSNLGNALRDQGKLDEAIAACQRAIALNPHFPEAHNNLGTALWKMGRLEEAAIAFRQACALRPTYAEAHNNLGAALCDSGHFGEAMGECREAIALQPNYADAYGNLGLAHWIRGDLDEAIAACRQAIALAPSSFAVHSNLLLALQCHPGINAGMIAEEHRLWNQRHAEPLRQLIPPHPNDRAPERRLRIGYVSPDFREHPVGRFLLPLLAEHDHRNFEIFCYAQVPAPDALTAELRAHADHWHSLTGLSDAQAAALIRRHEIDLLIDLSGHTAHHRLLIFAHQPATVQVTFLGYPNTTGLATMDYRLTDAHADPPGETEALHSEQLTRLPACAWCYQPAYRPEIAARHDGPIVFGCCNKLSKITEPLLALWSRILDAVPQSGLLLKTPALGDEGTRENFRRKLSKAGIARDRAELLGYEPSAEAHLALYDRITIALDTFPYHGTATTCEALWMGVPVVTLAGKTHVSRVGVSLLSQAGLSELVATSEDEYVQIAGDLARDRQRLADLRGTLRSRLEQSPLRDAPRYARDVEAAFREMWRRRK